MFGLPAPDLRRFNRWFYLFNALLLLLIGLRYFSVTSWPDSLLAQIYEVAMLLSHWPVVALPLLGLGWLLAVSTRSRRITVPLLVVAGGLLVMLVLMDTFVYQQYRFHINDSAALSFLLGGAADQVFSFSATVYATAAGIGAVILAIESLGAWLLLRLLQGRQPSLRPLALGLVTAYLVQTGIFAWSDAVAYPPVTRQRGVFFLYHPITMNKFLYRTGLVAEGDAYRRTVDKPARGGLDYPLQSVSCPADRQRPNILWILIDAWRADSMTPEITPHIAAFAPQTERFTDHLSSSSSTRGGVFTMFYGLPPTYWQAVESSAQPPVMMSKLKQWNYQFGVYGSAPLFSPEFDRTVFLPVDNLRLKTPGETSSARDKRIAEDFIDFLQTRDTSRPYFGFLFFDSAHAYNVPDDFHKPFTPSWDEADYLAVKQGMDPTPFVNLYRNALYYVDGLVGRVLDAVRAQGGLDNTVIMITGDHAQEFNDNGLNYWGHNSNFSRAQTHVPLLLYVPGRKPAEVSRLTSHYDIAPTFLHDIFACAAPASAYSEGQSLFSLAAENTLLLANYNDFALRTDNEYIDVDLFGNVMVRDRRYQPEPQARPTAAELKALLRLRTRFFKAPDDPERQSVATH